MSTERVVVTWAVDGSMASAIYDEHGRVRITDGERFGWAWLTHAEWEASANEVGG